MSTPITSTTSSSNIPTNAFGTAINSSASDPLGQNAFLNLLVTQLQNQDPSQPVDDSQWLSELAQFSSLEQMTNINTTLTGQGAVSQIGAMSSLIGKNVTTSATDANGSPIGGLVSAVGISDGVIDVTVGNNQVTLDKVTGISQ